MSQRLTHTRDIAGFCEQTHNSTTTFIFPDHTQAVVRNDTTQLVIHIAKHWRNTWAAAQWTFHTPPGSSGVSHPHDKMTPMPGPDTTV